MPAIFTHQTTGLTVQPLVLETQTATVTPGTVVRFAVGSASPYVTVGPASLRAGQHVLLLASQADAATALARLTAPGPIVLAYPEQPGWAMRFVVVEDAELELMPGLRRWRLTIGYQEVAA